MQNKQEFLYKGPNHAANLNDMRVKDKYCDVTIKVSGKEIRAHKVVLAANLNYFETMFSSDSFKESHDGLVTMESVEKADLELFVSYAYTGEILVTDSNVLNLLKLANDLSEDGIKEACIEFLEKHWKVEEACRAYKFANTIECFSLKNAAKVKIITNFGDCLECADYLDFDAKSLLDILSDGKAQSKQLQKILFEGLIRWIVHDMKERRKYLEGLLSFIDTTKLNGDDVNNCLYKHLAECDDEYEIVKNTIFFCEARKIERKEEEQVLIIISDGGSVLYYNFIERKWFEQQVIPNAAFKYYMHYSCAVLNDKLHYITSNSSGENCLQAFDPSSKLITRLHSSSSILGNAILCACNSFLYICGGLKQDDSASDQVLRYDPQTNSLGTLSLMGTKRWSAASIFYQGCLYVLGGCDGSSYLELVEKYDPVRNEWTAVAPMCEKRCGHVVAELNGKLYACGGFSGMGSKSSVEVYDPTTNSWQLVASMIEERCYFLGVAHEGKLLAMGGRGGGGGEEENTVEVYDPSKDQWQMNGEMSSSLPLTFYVGGLFLSSCIASS